MGNKRFFSIRSKVMLLSIVLTVVPLMIVSGFSYIESTKVVRSQVIALNLVNAKQISNTLDFIMNDVTTVSLNLIQNSEISAYLASDNHTYKQQSHSRMLSILNDQMFNKKYLYSIYIQSADGEGVDNRGAVNTLTDAMTENSKALAGRESWYYDSILVQNKRMKVITMVRELRDMNRISRSLGMLKINILESSIRELYRTKLQDDSLFYLLGPDNVILSSLSEEQVGRQLEPFLLHPDMGRLSEGYFNADVDGRKYLAVFYRPPTWGWEIIELTPYELIARPGNAIKRVTFFSIAASLAVCIIFILLFAARVLEPLKQIRILMKHVERENFNMEMKVKGNDEIASLSRSFNQMSHKLNELINEVHVSKIKQKEAELKALEEQINPHFLYNTLDLIYWMSRMEKAFDTSVMINSLSQLFRIGLNSGSRFTTVGKEVEHIRHYIQIQQKRYEETIAFTIEAAPETFDCWVTKMVLQPIVENAIRHGIEPRGGSGRIDIRIYREGDVLVYCVHDDGAGADEASVNEWLNELADEGKGKGLGLKNISDRIRLNSGSPFGVEFRSSQAEGTTVWVRQPFQKGMTPNV